MVIEFIWMIIFKYIEMESTNIVLKIVFCVAALSGSVVQGATWEVWREFSVVSPPNCFYLETKDGDDLYFYIDFEPEYYKISLDLFPENV